MTFPEKFLIEISCQIGSEFPDFEKAHNEPPPVSIRLNRKKTNIAPPGSDPVLWHPDGFYLPQRPSFTLDPTFHAGAFYVQEASSMFLDFALRQVADFSKPLKILDLCAAPGGKSTLLASMLRPGNGFLVANEFVRNRTGSLRENLEKWGFPNTAVTSGEAADFGKMENFFDVVVADAPCSGEGMFRKPARPSHADGDAIALSEWSPENVEMCTVRQRKILEEIAPAVKTGGILVFSTCTFNQKENEENVSWLLENFDFEQVRLEIPENWGIVETDGGYRFFQHRLRGEGFFISIFRKKSGVAGKILMPSKFVHIRPAAKNSVPEIQKWLSPNVEISFFETPAGEVLALPTQFLDDYLLVDKFLKIKWFGTPIGEMKGKDFVPSHALALSELASRDLPFFDLTRDEALNFLRKETLPVAENWPRGFALAKFEGLAIGWAKILAGRMNNYLPGERRIRMR